MAWQACLEVVANVAAIGTAGAAGWYTIGGWRDRKRKLKKLEDYLRKEKRDPGKDEDGKPLTGKHSIVHLMAELRLTEAEILNASFRSKYIKSGVKPDANKMATAILLEYVRPGDD